VAIQEEIAAVNLAKYRKMQHDLEESEARAEMAENVVGQMRSKGRTSTVTETTSVCVYDDSLKPFTNNKKTMS